MALNGKTAVTSQARARSAAMVTTVPPAAARSAAPALSATPASVPVMVALPAIQPKPGRARREALSRLGKAAIAGAAMTPRASSSAAAALQRRVAEERRVSESIVAGAPAETVTTTIAAEPVRDTTTAIARVVSQPTGRMLAKARRAALAQSGKSVLKRVAQATRIAAVIPTQDWQAAIERGATGRQIAMQRRLVQSLAGRVNEPNQTRPTGRMRPAAKKAMACAAADEPSPPAPAAASARLRDCLAQVTGIEAGGNGVTGTGHIDAAQGIVAGASRPPRGAIHAAVSEAAPRGVTGLAAGGHAVVTGIDEGGVLPTGGSSLSRSKGAVSAGERAKVTGTEYLVAEQAKAEFGAGSSTPRRSSVMSPPTGRSENARQKVTGNEAGASRTVSGSQYFSTADFASVRKASNVRRAVSVMRPFQRETGTAGGRHDPKLDGDAGLQATCVTEHPFGLTENTVAARRPAAAVIPAAFVTGDRPGLGGGRITGDERGAQRAVSGTPYLGEDNWPVEGGVTPLIPPSGRFLSPPRNGEMAETRMPAPSDFSIRSPARDAFELRQRAVTGASYGGEKITGPDVKASGLITGTPDFRHRRSLAVKAESAEVEGSEPVAPPRLRITGDCWHDNPRITGTEGASAQLRNPSLRGQPRGTGMNALIFKDIERPEPPDSPITGSAGNTRRGATVTVSGGARA